MINTAIKSPDSNCPECRKLKGYVALLWLEAFLLATGFLTWFILKVLRWS